jgi:hypothetical protein
LTNQKKGQKSKLGDSLDRKKFFEQKAADAKPKKVEKERVWSPNNEGGHTKSGFSKQTKAKLNLGAPPEPKKISDLP